MDIALLEDRNLVEFHHESFQDELAVGDIYLGRIKKIMPGLNAAFVDIGHPKDAFLHYHDLGPNVRSFLKLIDQVHKGQKKYPELSTFKSPSQIPKQGKIKDVLQPNQKAIVQIIKEPISTKGPRLSSEISIAGRYLILIPLPTGKPVAISRKIRGKDEKKRLANLIESIKPDGFGVIVRTQAEGQTVEEIDNDLRDLHKKWNKLFENLKNKEEKLLGETDKTQSLLRDLLNDSFNRITIDNKNVYQQLKNYVSRISPDKEEIVELYNNSSDTPFDKYKINNQIKSSFGKTANLRGGAYLVIEHTEALHVIDVNSGSKKNIEADQEETALKTNIEAVHEIARQLRLRDMGGIIVVDLIDMKSQAHRKQVYEEMKQAMKNDRAQHSFLPISKFGLMQITRQRVRPEVEISTTESCPTCRGTGKVDATIVLVDEIENQLDYLQRDNKKNIITIWVHPYLNAYINKGLLSLRMKWIWKYKMWIRIKEDKAFPINKYKILDKDNQLLLSSST